MINETTDVYSIMKKEFSETTEHFHMMNNKEIAAFLYYNARNEQFIGTDEHYYHNVNFKNLDTGKCSRMFTEGPIYFFPEGNDFVEPSNKMIAFRIHSKEAKVIRINDKGLFIEIYNLEDNNITTYYYDMSALASLSEFGYAAGSVDYIDEKIQDRGFKPDKTLYAEKSADGIYFSIKENGETVFEEQKPLDENRTFYSVYFEKMKSMGLYLDAQKVDSGTSR